MLSDIVCSYNICVDFNTNYTLNNGNTFRINFRLHLSFGIPEV